MAATPGTTSGTRTNREHPAVTRHDLRSRHAETPAFRPIAWRMPFAKIRAKALTICRSDLPIHGPPDENISLATPTTTHGDAGTTSNTTRQN
jgi:hypothetical protein